MFNKELLLQTGSKKQRAYLYMPSHWGTAESFEHLEEPYRSIRREMWNKRNDETIELSDECGIATVKDLPSDFFKYCKNLKRVRGSCFSHNHSVEYNSFFGKEPKLEFIPEDLFNALTNAIDFSNCFKKCYDLKSIPEKLFEKNVNATTFRECFNNCFRLKAIPEKLFEKNVNATDFDYCFYGCDSLTTVPRNLFMTNVNATNFTGCFAYCSSLQKNAPQLVYYRNASTKFVWYFSYVRFILWGLLDHLKPVLTQFDNSFATLVSKAMDLSTLITSKQIYSKDTESTPDYADRHNFYLTLDEKIAETKESLRQAKKSLYDEKYNQWFEQAFYFFKYNLGDEKVIEKHVDLNSATIDNAAEETKTAIDNVKFINQDEKDLLKSKVDACAESLKDVVVNEYRYKSGDIRLLYSFLNKLDKFLTTLG